jgi:hypothetical protein
MQSLLGRIARNGRGQLHDFVAVTGMLGDAAILTVPTTTLWSTLQVGAEAFTVLAQTFVILTGAALSDHFGFDDKGVRALLHGVLDGSLPITTGFRSITATHARTDFWVAYFFIVKAGTIEFQAP